jgi:hypothetical protein
VIVEGRQKRSPGWVQDARLADVVRKRAAAELAQQEFSNAVIAAVTAGVPIARISAEVGVRNRKWVYLILAKAGIKSAGSDGGQ